MKGWDEWAWEDCTLSRPDEHKTTALPNLYENYPVYASLSNSIP